MIFLPLFLLVSFTYAEVIARVDGKVLTYEEFKKAFEVYWKEILHLDTVKPTRENKRKFFLEYVKGMLIERVAVDMGIRVSEEEIDNRLKRWGRENASPTLRRLIKREILVEKLTDCLTKDISVSEKEITAYYLLNKRDFYLPTQVKLLPFLAESKREAELLYRSLLRKEKIPSNVKAGKERWYSLQSLPHSLRRSLYPYKKESVSKPIKINGGYLVLKITDKRKPGLLPLEEIKERVRRKLLNVKKEEVLKKWFREILKRYPVEVYPSKLD